MPKKVQEPWDHYQTLNRRLSEWADWIHWRMDELGWNVYQGDQEQSLRVQLRNDLHADKVYQEVANMDSDVRRNIDTNTAWMELPKLWRDMIYLLYVERKAYAKAEMAERMNLDRRDIATHLWHAFEQLDMTLAGIREARRNAT